MNELFQDIVKLSEALTEKITLLSSHMDREALAAEEYSLTLYRDDLIHTLENVKDLTEAEILSLGKEIQKASETRRTVKDMVIFFDHKYLQFRNLANELHRFNRTMKRDETRYLFKTEAGVSYFKELMNRPYDSKVTMDLETYTKKHSKLLSGEVSNVWELLEDLKTNGEPNSTVQPSTPITPVINRKATTPIIPVEVTKQKEVVEVKAPTEKEKVVVETKQENEVMVGKEFQPKQNTNLVSSVSEIASNKEDVKLTPIIVSIKDEIRKYIVQGPNKGSWELYSKKEREVIRSFFKMSHLLDYLINNEIYANYEKGMDKTQVKQMLQYLK